jgi:hypothetical protein
MEFRKSKIKRVGCKFIKSMKNLCTLMVIGILTLGIFSANADTGYFSSLSKETVVENNIPQVKKPADKVKIGNKTGEITVEVNFGIFKVTIKKILCDNYENRICYEKKGESTAEPIMITTDDNIITGELQTAPQEIDHGTYTETIFRFYTNTFNESTDYSIN